MLTKNKIEIINETKKYYENNVRSVKNDICSYYGDNGELCAFSRCCSNPESIKGFTTTVENMNKNYGINPELLLKDEYKGHSLQFWDDIQGFHDLSRFWEAKDNKERGNILTKEGIAYYESLLEKYKDQ